VTAEYAIIVVDRWHRRGVGGLLTDYCLEVAKQWGVKQVVAETATDNAAMIELFKKRGFQIDINREDDIVYVRKEVK
jgi:acetyltransferase